MTDALNTAWKAVSGLAYAAGDQPAPAPHLPDGRRLKRYMVATMLAVLPAVGVAVACFGWRVLGVAAVAFTAGRAVEVLTARCRGKATRGGALVVALLLALMLPSHMSLWLVFLAAAFGVFFAREVFGGAGHNVFNPVLVGVAFAIISFPALAAQASFASLAADGVFNLMGTPVPIGLSGTAAIGLAGLILLASRAVDWRIVLSICVAAIGVAAGLSFAGVGEPQSAGSLLTGGGFLLGAFVLAGDPATAPGTRAGRWLCGAVIGVAAAVMAALTQNAHFMLYAILLGNVAAPSLDAAVLNLSGNREAA